MNELANCPSCGELFVKSLRNICHNCYKQEEAQFDKVYTYVRQRDNREATIPQVEQATGVKEDTIMRFIKEGRLRVANFPNLGYQCETCGNLIQTGRICSDCQSGLRKGIEQHDREQAFRQQNRERATYFSKNQ